MRTRTYAFLWGVRTGAIIGTFALFSAGALNLVAKLAEPRLRVGDIVVFQAADEEASEGGGRLLVHRSNQFGCVLDLHTLRQSGGSLVVEGQVLSGSGAYQLHWAGQRTSVDGGDCGSDADLIVDARDLHRIASAAATPDAVATASSMLN